MKNPTLKWIVFFPAIYLLYLFISFVWSRISLFSMSSFFFKSFVDMDTDKMWEAVIYLILGPIIAGYLIAKTIYKLCPKPRLGAQILTGFYLFYAGSVYLKPKIWNIGSLSALWYDGVILCFLIYVSFEKLPSEKSVQPISVNDKTMSK